MYASRSTINCSTIFYLQSCANLSPRLLCLTIGSLLRSFSFYRFLFSQSYSLRSSLFSPPSLLSAFSVFSSFSFQIFLPNRSRRFFPSVHAFRVSFLFIPPRFPFKTFSRTLRPFFAALRVFALPLAAPLRCYVFAAVRNARALIVVPNFVPFSQSRYFSRWTAFFRMIRRFPRRKEGSRQRCEG